MDLWWWTSCETINFFKFLFHIEFNALIDRYKEQSEQDVRQTGGGWSEFGRSKQKKMVRRRHEKVPRRGKTIEIYKPNP